MSVLVLIGLLCVLLFLYTIYLNRSKPKNFPPGPPRLPIFGSYLSVLLEDHKYSHKALIKLCEKYKTKVLGFYLGDIPAVTVCDFELSKLCFTKDEFIGKGFSILSEARGQGKKIGVFFTEETFWHEQRRFSLRYLRDFGFGRRSDPFEEVITSQVRDLIDTIQNGAQREEDKEICRRVGEIYMPDTLFGYYQSCIWYILCGQLLSLKDLRKITNVSMGFQRSVDALGGMISFAPWIRHFAPEMSGYKYAKQNNYEMYLFCKKIVEEHLETYQEEHHRDFIDVYIAKIKELNADNIYNSSFTIEQLIFVVMDFMFPSGVAMGHTTNIFFAFLLNYPDVQKKIHLELDGVVGKSRLPNLDDRKDLIYLEATLREVFRIEPANPLGIGRVSLQDAELDGYFIPKGTVIVPNVYHAHHQADIWGDPENFRPERWIHNGNLVKRDFTLGFGGGKRLCAGETFSRQTMFLFIAGMLQNFEFVPAELAPPDLKDLIPGINMSVKNFWMKAIQR